MNQPKNLLSIGAFTSLALQLYDQLDLLQLRHVVRIVTFPRF